MNGKSCRRAEKSGLEASPPILQAIEKYTLLYGRGLARSLLIPG
jgi:hypothetical protein